MISCVEPNSVLFDACFSVLTIPSGMKHGENWSGLSSWTCICYLQYAEQLWNVSEDWSLCFITLTLEKKHGLWSQTWKECCLCATHCSKRFMEVNSFILTTALWSVCSILQMRSLRHRVKKCAQNHLAVRVRASIRNQAVWPQRPSSQSFSDVVSQRFKSPECTLIDETGISLNCLPLSFLICRNGPGCYKN